MIEYNLSEQAEGSPGEGFSVRVIGVGGAGANVLDRMALEGSDEAELLTLNTDMRALSTSVSNNKIQLGKTLLKGMGAGGDPELGKQGALEAVDEIRASLRGHKMAFVCVGLGGGTGSGAAPEVCRVAKEEGVFLVAFATLPFTFEGKRRMDQAREALDRIGRYANAVVTFDNDRMGELIVPKEGVQQAFAAADRIISQAIRATMKIVSHPGIIRVGMDELLSALDNDNSRCLFGFGVAKGDNRAQDALEQALKSPLLDAGKMLADARNVLVHVGGGDSMTLAEVELVMQELAKHIDDSRTQILFGTGTDKKLDGSLTVTVISSLASSGGASPGDPGGGDRHRDPEPEAPPPRLGSPSPAPMSPPPAPAPGPEYHYDEPVAAADSAENFQTSSGDSLLAGEISEEVPWMVAPPPLEDPELEVPLISPWEPPAFPEAEEEDDWNQEDEDGRQEDEGHYPRELAAVAEEPGEEEAPPAWEPEREAPELKPVRKTAVVPPPVARMQVVDVPASASRRAADPAAPPSASASEEAVEESIGNMLRQGIGGTGLEEDPADLPETTLDIPDDATVPVRPLAARSSAQGETIVARTEDSQQISLTRLVPGAPPSATGLAAGEGPSVLLEEIQGGPGQAELDAAAAQHQQMLQLEPVNKGRFAKTEPTIVDGEDMDVPTFLRKRRK